MATKNSFKYSQSCFCTELNLNDFLCFQTLLQLFPQSSFKEKTENKRVNSSSFHCRGIYPLTQTHVLHVQQDLTQHRKQSTLLSKLWAQTVESSSRLINRDLKAPRVQSDTTLVSSRGQRSNLLLWSLTGQRRLLNNTYQWGSVSCYEGLKCNPSGFRRIRDQRFLFT